jgi:hypothetical protein
MKNVIAILSVLLSLNSFAVTANNTWEEIQAARNISIKAPTVAFDAGAALTFISVLDLCVNVDEVNTLVPFNVYKHVVIGHRNDLEVIGHKILSKPLTYTQTVWRKLPGSSTEVQVEVTETIAQNYKIDVVSKMDGSSNEGNKLFTKEFLMPLCK